MHGHRGLAGNPLHRARRSLHTLQDLLPDGQRLLRLFAVDEPELERLPAERFADLLP